MPDPLAPLTAKERAFVLDLQAGFTLAEAAKRGGSKAKPHTLANCGYQIRRRPRVAKAIAELGIELKRGSQNRFRERLALARANLTREEIDERELLDTVLGRLHPDEADLIARQMARMLAAVVRARLAVDAMREIQNRPVKAMLLTLAVHAREMEHIAQVVNRDLIGWSSGGKTT